MHKIGGPELVTLGAGHLYLYTDTFARVQASLRVLDENRVGVKYLMTQSYAGPHKLCHGAVVSFPILPSRDGIGYAAGKHIPQVSVLMQEKFIILAKSG